MIKGNDFGSYNYRQYQYRCIYLKYVRFINFERSLNGKFDKILNYGINYSFK